MAQTAAAEHGSQDSKASRQKLVLGALGIVFGDIGTSPLYTVKQCFLALGGITPYSIYGVLSLITWALFSVVTLKYISVIMRADNRGEGGILSFDGALALRTAAPAPSCIGGFSPAVFWARRCSMATALSPRRSRC